LLGVASTHYDRGVTSKTGSVAPLDGIRVLEVANWLAAPAAGALLADLGADVIKVEPPGGDVFREFVLRSMGYTHDFATNYAFQLDNRGKRSVTVALDRPGGPALLRRMSERVDVFLTNLVQQRRERYGLTYDEVRAVSPRIVYASFSGYGTRGPDRNRPGFDYAAFWARSGLMGLLGEPPSPPPLCRGGQGDHTTALNILAAVLAALRVRDRTDAAQHVEVTLQGTGMWTLGGDLQAALIAREQPARHERTRPANPIWNSYRAADGAWLLLVMPQPDPDYWPRFCKMMGRPEWAHDPRYDTLAKRRQETVELTATIDRLFAEHDLAYWSAQLDAHGLIWAPVATLVDVIDDPQAREMGWFTTLTHPSLGPFETLDTPFRIYDADVGARGPAPAAGEHTFDVLAELGIDGDELARLATEGVIG
jgi:crotonobetainyl-CoA:carnitine CoA-transferase CaiB-like acyl-CoA transferase